MVVKYQSCVEVGVRVQEIRKEKNKIVFNVPILKPSKPHTLKTGAANFFFACTYHHLMLN